MGIFSKPEIIIFKESNSAEEHCQTRGLICVKITFLYGMFWKLHLTVARESGR